MKYRSGLRLRRNASNNSVDKSKIALLEEFLETQGYKVEFFDYTRDFEYLRLLSVKITNDKSSCLPQKPEIDSALLS
jgi:hypothetical protein